MIYIYDIYPDENLKSLACHKFQTIPSLRITLKKVRNKLQKSESVSVFGPRSNPDKSLKGKLCDASIKKNVKCWKLVWEFNAQ